MSGKFRPSLRAKVLENLKSCNLSHTDKDCIKVAFERFAPKKPNIHGYDQSNLINSVSYTCPDCNKHIGRDKYCKHCGQALDWSDTE